VLFGFLMTSLFLAMIRLIRGPSLPDRVVALDLIAITAVGLIGVYAVRPSSRFILMKRWCWR
jgi:multicomponent Na+:H+ antiporter subunit F